MPYMEAYSLERRVTIRRLGSNFGSGAVGATDVVHVNG